MTRLLSLFVTMLVSFGALAEVTNQRDPLEVAASENARKRFCKTHTGPRAIQTLLKSYDNQLTFDNRGGTLGGGVCWWHSRFTRNAAYLARFRPDLPKPDSIQAKALIKALRHGQRIVEIPGYTHLRNFSYEWQHLIQDRLNDWQRTDGVLGFDWLRGLRGNSTVSAKTMESMMEKLLARVQNGEVVFQRLQMPGITNHAWLVVDMYKTQYGYTLNVLDSNFAGMLRSFHYMTGNTSFSYVNGSSFVPYTAEMAEERRFQRIVEKECADLSTTAPRLSYDPSIF